jgi:hypothetical protein
MAMHRQVEGRRIEHQQRIEHDAAGEAHQQIPGGCPHQQVAVEHRFFDQGLHQAPEHHQHQAEPHH